VLQTASIPDDNGICLQEIFPTGKVFFTPARLVSASEVQCDMPFSIVDIEITWTSITWLVSVSNDNVTFSNQTSVFVFDSKCLICTNGPSTCQQKVIFNYDCMRNAVSD